ncbi:AraC family transcriptional regulator [Phaeovulum sp.]|uniref:AraC family transcriptional regulator n=1 Tax=Phaeovulum sp. TaxID=2934796 RepID=UPI0039E315D3
MFTVEIRQEPFRRLAAVAHSGPYPKISHAFERLGTILQSRDLYGKVGNLFGVYHDDPTATAPVDLRSHAGVMVPDDITITPPLELITLPAGRHAVLTYKGPYSGLPAAYDYLHGTWLAGAGAMPADSAVFEIYLNNPMTTAPGDLLTEICLPLR